MTAQPTARCATCGETHEYHPERGWYAEDGHPYARQEYPPLAAVPNNAPNRAGTRGVFFGALEACERCGAVLAPEHHDLRAIHAQVCPGGAA